jgi:putative hydrolase of the HAD superfamily
VRRNDFVVLADADNTLWDTDSIFANAQLKLLERVERFTGRTASTDDRLNFVRSCDQALASRHHLHFRYPIRMLAATLASRLHSELLETAAESALQGRPSAHRLSEDVIDDLIAAYSQELAKVPDLLPTVRAGLELAKCRNLRVFVITEGKLGVQRHVLSHHNLEKFVENVWELTKTVDQFKRLLRRFHPAELVVIGDQIERDIAPAHDAECRTVLVPSRFKPNWRSTRDDSAADCVVSNFLEAIEWILRCSETLSR